MRLNERIEPVQIDRLDQMMLEAAIVASPNVFFHAETGQRDSEDRPRFAQALHQIDAGAIRQTDVAHENIEFVLRCHFDRARDVVRRLDLISTPSQELSERAVGVFVIFDQQNPE